MRDIDVRLALRKAVTKEFRKDAGTLILEELGILNGECRIDLAVVNGKLHGYEIKSDMDTLDRLPVQASAYNEVFDRIHLVVGERHWKKALDLVAPSWGIYVATQTKGRTILREDRPAQDNPNVVARSLARLLWRSELVTILEELGVKSVRSKRASDLHSLLINTVAVDCLRRLVRETLKSRPDWRVDALRMPDDGSSQPPAK